MPRPCQAFPGRDHLPLHYRVTHAYLVLTELDYHSYELALIMVVYLVFLISSWLKVPRGARPDREDPKPGCQ